MASSLIRRRSLASSDEAKTSDSLVSAGSTADGPAPSPLVISPSASGAPGEGGPGEGGPGEPGGWLSAAAGCSRCCTWRIWSVTTTSSWLSLPG